MALARGAGTETLRSHIFEQCTSTVTKLIIGEQHPVYPVITIIVHAMAVATDGNFSYVQSKLLEERDAKKLDRFDDFNPQEKKSQSFCIFN